MIVGKHQDWPLLRWIWRALIVAGKAAMLGFIGLWICGLGSAILTSYCYMIGVYAGIPLGLALGVVLSTRVRAADVLFVFGSSAWTWILADRLTPPPPSPPDELLYMAIAPSIGALVAAVGFCSRGLVPYRWKLASGLLLSAGVTALGIGLFLVWLYR